MRVLFLFLDGVGLGVDDPKNNPFAAATLPTLSRFTNGQRWLRGLRQIETDRSIFVETDASLGVEGNPQSATGQAAILTGKNIPAIIGYHYGPKPNATIRALIRQDNLIKQLATRGLSVSFLNAYPSRFFANLESGKRLLSSVQFTMQTSGIPLLGESDLRNGHAFSVDFTGYGWREILGYKDTPLLSPEEAGEQLAKCAEQHHFTFFDHWVTDYIGHKGTLEEAIRNLEKLDAVIKGLLKHWDDTTGVIILTSDHGNLENIQARGHTVNPVPTVIIGDHRHAVAENLRDLTGFAAPIIELLSNS